MVKLKTRFPIAYFIFVFLVGRDTEGSTIVQIQARAFVNNSRLTRVYLQNSAIKAVHQDAFVGLLTVEQLFLHKNYLDYLAPGTFRDLLNLKRLNLHHNQLTTILPGTFTGLRNLRHVMLHDNTLNVVHVMAFDQTSLSHLQSLSLHGNKLHCNCSTLWLTSLITRLRRHALAHHTDHQTLTDDFYRQLQEPWLCSSPPALTSTHISDLTGHDVHCTSPTIYIHPAGWEVPVGGFVRFLCFATGHPLPTITWRYEGQEIQFTRGHNARVIAIGHTLLIRGVRESDTDAYSCEASNEGGHAQETANLVILPEQRPPDIMIVPESKYVNVTGHVTFNCRTQDNTDTVSWLIHGERISDLPNLAHRVTVNGERLAIHNVQQSDAGEITCQAQNLYGTTTSGAQLHVNVPPQLQQLTIAKTLELVRETLHKYEHFPHCNGKQHSLHTLIDMADENFVQAISHIDGETRQHLDLVRKARRIIEAGEVQLTRGPNRRRMRHVPGSFVSEQRLQEVSHVSGCQRRLRMSRCHNMCFHRAFRPADGSCNNLENPEWGASHGPLVNVLPPIYEDGFDMPKGYHVNASAPPPSTVTNCGSPVSLVRIPTPDESHTRKHLPSARLVSSRLLSRHNIVLDDDYSHFLMQFGQFLDHDITLSETDSTEACRFLSCEEQHHRVHSCMSISIPPDDKRINTSGCMGTSRSRAVCGTGESSIFFEKMQRRQQLNVVTAFIDGSQIYGSDDQTVRILRQGSTSGLLRENQIRVGGKGIPPLAARGEADCMRPFRLPGSLDFECLVAGDRRINEQLDLTALHLLWFRQHKLVVRQLARLNTHWGDARLYHEARKIIGAQLQHITFKHWLPKVLGEAGMRQLGSYAGYDSKINPGIFAAFSTAAFRFGHAMINPVIKRLNASMKPIPEGNLQLRDAFFAVTRLIHEGGVDPLLRGLFMTPSKRLTPQRVLAEEVTEHLFQQSLEIAEDLGALNIQRGRDHGLPGYNAYRQYCNLSTFDTFEEMESVTDQAALLTLASLYSKPDHVDLFVGGLLERPLAPARIGPLFSCLLVKQMRVLRDGDRFWYESDATFTGPQLREIRKTTLSAIICDNSDNITHVPPDAFRLAPFPEGFVPCNTLPRMNLSVWKSCEECDVFDCQSAINRRRRDVVNSQHLDGADLLAFGQMSWQDILKTMPGTPLAESLSSLVQNMEQMSEHLKKFEQKGKTILW